MALGPDSKAAAVSPQPGLLRTIGILNFIFGGLLFACGLNCLGWFGPMLATLQLIRLDPEEAQIHFDNFKRTMIATLRDREASATDAERTRIKKSRVELEALHPRIGDQLDLKKINRGLRWLTWYLWADVVTGPILNLLMLASGIGLMQLKCWARTMGLWVAAAKLVRLAALTIFLVAMVIPRMSKVADELMASDFGRVLITSALAQQGARQGGDVPVAQIDPKDLVPIMTGMSDIAAVLLLGFGAIYPALTLVVLSRPAARAACREDEAETDGDGA
ncbi:MAG: hypothetical protein JO329_00360 [Planctomycetaceae bacterium]|nr:hypothetical protein [Planctomycetaceae bacterium]MBV8558980.1 hypothetical protein [Planctomycetaceae bacterium]MBV8611088.1 hypothetical protein [Singulisphaera sp.]